MNPFDATTIVPWRVVDNDTSRQTFTVLDDADTPVDVSAWEWTGRVLTEEGGTVVFAIPFNTSAAGSGILSYSLSGEGSPAPGRYWYQLKYQNDAEGLVTWQAGPLTMELDYTA